MAAEIGTKNWSNLSQSNHCLWATNSEGRELKGSEWEKKYRDEEFSPLYFTEQTFYHEYKLICYKEFLKSQFKGFIRFSTKFWENWKLWV